MPVTGEAGGAGGVTGRLLTARVVAQRLGLCTETVLAWVRDGELPAFRLPGGAIRFDEGELDQWLQARRAAPRRGVSPARPGAARPVRLTSNGSPAPEDEED
jgi:excisionase family DNA binding protein